MIERGFIAAPSSFCHRPHSPGAPAPMAEHAAGDGRVHQAEGRPHPSVEAPRPSPGPLMATGLFHWGIYESILHELVGPCQMLLIRIIKRIAFG